MKFIERTDEFLARLSEIESLINRNETLPRQVFKEQFTKFLIISFDEILEDFFFQKMNSFVKKINDQKWIFAVLDPEPQNFFHYFKKYPIFGVSFEDSYEDYFFVTRNEPEPNSDDAIVYNMEDAVLYSTSLSWAIYADRDFELGIIAFRDDETMKTFIAEFKEDKILTIAEAIPELLEVMYTNNSVPDDIRKELLNNYTQASKE